jgi:ribose-phosphate pyrophosphokinase
MSVLVFVLPGSDRLGHRLSESTGFPLGRVTTRRFPDDEVYVRVEAECGQASVVLACSLDRPDRKLLPLLCLADAVRELGAVRVGLVAPYLAYLRQDRRFMPGEAVTSRTFSRLLSRSVDWLATVDPHLHRYASLSEVYDVPCRVVRAAPALADWIAQHVDRPVIVGPDEESQQWVSEVAVRAGASWLVMRKTRLGDRSVEVSAPDVSAYRQHTPVVVDDIVSSAQTMVATVRTLVGAGLRAPVCLGVHALFSETAERDLRAAGAAEIVTTTTVPHATGRIDIVPLLAPAVRELAG